MKPTIKKAVIAGLALLALALTLGIAYAAFGSESLEAKIKRLDFAYNGAIEQIKQAEESIEKLNDIKAKAEYSLKSITVDLASAKAQYELQKAEPDLAEVNRLTEKANTLAQELKK